MPLEGQVQFGCKEGGGGIYDQNVHREHRGTTTHVIIYPLVWIYVARKWIEFPPFPSFFILTRHNQFKV